MRTDLASLVEDFRSLGARRPGEIAVVEHRGVRSYRTSYGSLAMLAGRFAAELDRRRILPGERVVLWGANSAHWIAAFFGCLLRGVLAVPLDDAGSPAFTERVLADVSPSLILTDHPLPAASGSGQHSVMRLAHLADLLPSKPLFAVSSAVAPEAAFQIVFTSGTTSEPKGVVHTHRNVLASLGPIESEIGEYRRYERWVHPLRFLHTLPLSHVFGQFMGLWIPALLGAELHFAERQDPAAQLALLCRERISVLIAVPRVLALLRVHLLRRFPTLRAELDGAAHLSIGRRWWQFRAVHRALGWKFWAVISGGAQVGEELEQFWSRLGFALIQGYGMTETAALITLNHPFHIGRGTLGQLLPGRELRLSDSGEILVRGEMVSRAFWQHGRIVPREEEWLSTGDLASADEAGQLRFLGRSSDTIVTAAGLNLFPADIEAALLAQPGIRDCAVVPCPLPTGTAPVTVVLTDLPAAALERAVFEANRVLSTAQQIRRVLPWPEPKFPFTSTGKLLRREIRDWACASLARGLNDVPESRSRPDPLLHLIAEVTGEPVRTQSPDAGPEELRLSEDLHLDSLGRVQLGSLLQQEADNRPDQLPLSDDTLATVETVGQLRRLMAPGGGVVAARGPEGEMDSSLPVAVRAHAPAHRYPTWPWTRPVRLARALFTEAILRPLVRLLLAPRIVHAHGPLPAGPLLIISNHVTMLDGALVISALPPHLRHRVAIAMSGEMLHDFRRAENQPNWLARLLAPAAYWLLTGLFNVFPLPRLRGFRDSFAHAGHAMDQGFSVLIFPEGTRSKTAAMLPFRPGIGLLAAEARVPILPVALLGLDAIRARRVSWYRSGTIEIRIGEPIVLPDGGTPEDGTARLEATLRALGAG